MAKTADDSLLGVAKCIRLRRSFLLSGSGIAKTACILTTGSALLTFGFAKYIRLENGVFYILKSDFNTSINF